ncbi:MAG: energy-coupling factor transporter transmembrane protein EcfT [Halovenus sp.]
MVRYTPGRTLAHRLDPRTKLCFQAGFAVAVFSRPTPLWLAGMTVVALLVLVVAGASLRRTLRAYWFVLLFLALGPVIAALTLGPPWVDIDRAAGSALAVARVVPILLVSGAYVHATPIRDTRAAVQRTVPGRAGRLLGVGMGLTFRFVPVVREDVRRVRDAVLARGGRDRPFRDRVSRIATLSVVRALDRRDRLAVALRARCFAWNPTLPRLAFERADYPVLALSVVLALTPLL